MTYAERRRRERYAVIVKRDFLRAAKLPASTPIRFVAQPSETLYVYLYAGARRKRYVCYIGSDDDGFAFHLDQRKRVGTDLYGHKAEIIFDFSPEYIKLLEEDI